MPPPSEWQINMFCLFQDRKIHLSDDNIKVQRLKRGTEIPYKIHTMGSYLVVEANNGLVLAWNRKTTVMIRLQPKFKVGEAIFTFVAILLGFWGGSFFYYSSTPWLVLFFSRENSAVCAETTTEEYGMISPPETKMLFRKPLTLQTAGKCQTTAPTQRTKKMPAPCTQTDMRGHQNTAASSGASFQCFLLAMQRQGRRRASPN